jgi:PqqD family protein of HPr-rel-A system
VNAIRHSRPRRKDGVTLRRSVEEIILFDPESEDVHFVNTTAAAIWELCDGQTEEAEMVEAICQLTGMPYEMVEEDVSALLQELDAAGLITWSDDAPAAPPGVLEAP